VGFVQQFLCPFGAELRGLLIDADLRVVVHRERLFGAGVIDRDAEEGRWTWKVATRSKPSSPVSVVRSSGFVAGYSRSSFFTESRMRLEVMAT
jgi:hypothetical protein